MRYQEPFSLVDMNIWRSLSPSRPDERANSGGQVPDAEEHEDLAPQEHLGGEDDAEVEGGEGDVEVDGGEDDVEVEGGEDDVEVEGGEDHQEDVEGYDVEVDGGEDDDEELQSAQYMI